MEKYLHSHERWLKNKIKQAEEGKAGDWKETEIFNHHEIMNLQHERLIHLVVTMFVGLFLLIVFTLLIFAPRWEVVILLFILLILFGFYIRHYFRLENGVQKLYELTLELRKKTGNE